MGVAKMNQEEFTSNTGISKIDRYGWKLRDTQGQFCLVNKLELQISSEYQRDANENKIRALASNWSWIACGAILVGIRDGSLFVIDGQHRVMAARRRHDIKDLPCLVFQTADVQQEATGFLNANTMRKPITSVDKFKALAVTNDSVALAAQSLIASSGREISMSAGANTVRCISVIQWWIRNDKETIERVWPLIVEICEGHVFNEKLVDGLCYLESRMPVGQSICDREFRGRFTKAGYSRLLEGANRGASFFARGGAKSWALGMVEETNKKCRNKIELLEKVKKTK